MDRKTAKHLAIIRFGGLLLMGACLALAGCAKEVVPPPLPIYPGKVVTDEGMALSVWDIRLPGTRQELMVKTRDIKTWVPFSIIHGVRFWGPEKDGFREGEIFLNTGERLRGLIFVGGLLEGRTDVGYWNMPLKKVERFQMVDR